MALNIEKKLYMTKFQLLQHKWQKELINPELEQRYQI